MNPTEQQAIAMLKAKQHQPSEIARITGLSQIWVELQAEKLGMIPLTVGGVQ